MPNIHLIFRNEDDRTSFSDQFSQYYPRNGFDIISGSQTLEMPPRFISQLQTMFYQTTHGQINSDNRDNLEEQKRNLIKLYQEIQQYNLYKRLDNAHTLALDYSNLSSVGLNDFEASSAYAMSLKVYAEINRDNLNPDQYRSLLYASSILAAYDDNNALNQSLKTDSNFIAYMRQIYVRNLNFPTPRPLIDHLPLHDRQEIHHSISQNITTILNGHPKAPLGKQTYFKMKRFLPDHQMRSETDEIVFQAGGMINHSAMFRIIKVGMLLDGTEAGPYDLPHHYEYYKVENNLGAGCHNKDTTNRTCSGTYVTKLEPWSVDQQGTLRRQMIDPYRDPEAYQAAMSFTLQELLRAEDILCFIVNLGLDKMVKVLHHSVAMKLQNGND